jgi:hypothetical protein
VCPFEFAWVDKPDKLGNHHKYAECSNRGICDRDTGECECFPGYEGKACKRTSCPNDCSGHGRCLTIENMPFYVTSSPWYHKPSKFYNQKAVTFKDSYHKWDYGKTRGCQCDPEWGDVDCSKRMCQHGNDIMDQRDNLLQARKYHVQHIQFLADSANDGAIHGKTFALTFRSKLNETFTTIPIVMDRSTGGFRDFLLDVEYALEGLPNNVIDDVSVQGNLFTTGPANMNFDATHPTNIYANTASINSVYLNITFVGENVQGPQNLLEVKHIMCGDGCTPKLSGLELSPTTMNVTEIELADYNSYECGRRGKCDYATGQCECFSGYSGLACGTITSLI